MKKYIVTAKEIRACDYEVIAETPAEAKEKVLKGECDPCPPKQDFDPVFIEPEDLWGNVKGVDKLVKWEITPFAPITLHRSS
tara:strand:- start:156 stop:401 length:246 start_codon:yes stop_codon:yes gene_type:complete